MKLIVKCSPRARQPWHWSLLYDNGDSASDSTERFPDERCVARAVYRYLETHESNAELMFRGVRIRPERWNYEPESMFVKHLLRLIRERPPEGMGIGGRGTKSGKRGK